MTRDGLERALCEWRDAGAPVEDVVAMIEEFVIDLIHEHTDEDCK